MVTVPYNPVPEVAPADTPAPLLHVQATPDAFGVGIAGAIKQLGGTLEKGGGELFDRAVAMQQLTNETERSNAVNEVEKRNSLSWEKYKSLQGINAVKGFPAYQDELAKNRDEIRAGLSNPMVQKMFDTQANSITNRLMTYGAGHSAQQNKVAADGAAKATVSTAQDAILQNPEDMRGYDDRLIKIENAVRDQADLQGWSPEQTENEVAKARSLAMRNLMEGTNHTDPDKAKAMLDENRKYMHANDINHLEPKIQSQVRLVGSRNISDAVNKGWAPYMSPAQISKMDGVQEPLARILQQAQRDNPDLRILPTSGFRTVEKQAELRARYEAGGPLAARPGESAHNFGRGVDVVPGAGTTYEQIDAAMKAASEKLGIPLSPEHDRIKYRDPGHFSIPGDYDVGTAPKKVDEPEQSRVNRAEEFARTINTDDPLFADAARERTAQDYTRARRIAQQTDFDNKETVIKGIMDHGNGQPASSVDELFSNTEVRAAYDSLPPHDQRAMMAALDTSIRKQQTRTDEPTLGKYKGMSQDPNSREEFLGVNFWDPKLKLSNPDRNSLFNRQNYMRKHPEEDSKLGPALKLLAPDMAAAGVSKKDNADEYWSYVGALEDALNYETKIKNRPPSISEIQEIGKRLRYDVLGRGWWSWTETPLFKGYQNLSSAEQYRIELDLQKKSPGMTFSDIDRNREYARQQYKKLFGGSAGTTSVDKGAELVNKMKGVDKAFWDKTIPK